MKSLVQAYVGPPRAFHEDTRWAIFFQVSRVWRNTEASRRVGDSDLEGDGHDFHGRRAEVLFASLHVVDVAPINPQRIRHFEPASIPC